MSHRSFSIAVIVFSVVAFASVCAAVWFIFIAYATQVQSVPTEDPVAPLAEVRVPGALESINQYRASKGLAAVQLDVELNRSSQAKAQDLVDRHYFEHFYEGQSPWDFMTAAGFEYVRAGENLARCYKDGPAVVKAWINSPTHEAILTGDYTVAGLGIAYSSEDHCNYVVGHFGSKS